MDTPEPVVVQRKSAEPDRTLVLSQININVSLCPCTISRITAAALVILHVEHGRTT